MKAREDLIRFLLCCTCAPMVVLAAAAGFSSDAPRPAVRQRIVAHYMPWYEAPPERDGWGWHWTMNHFQPDRIVGGRREIASHFTPLIGPYDSCDADVLEYHLLTMKLAGIDGVIVDWYGLQEFRDFAALHRATERLVEQVEQLGMTFAICYEDQTIPALIEAGRLKPDERVAHAGREIDWLAEHWFGLESYLKLDGRPVLLSFGQTGLTDAEWTTCLERASARIAYFSLHHRRSSALGAFDWPLPAEGAAAADRFRTAARDWPAAIPTAFPRFVDVYAQTGVGPSYGRIDDDGGAILRKLLEAGLAAGSPVVQIATWNDWGEGTMVEPSVEFGYRDLETVQAVRRRVVDPEFAATLRDLRLPHKLLECRRRATDGDSRAACDQVSQLLSTGRLAEARAELSKSP